MDYEAGGRCILCRHAQSKWEEILTVSSEEAGSEGGGDTTLSPIVSSCVRAGRRVT